jgi:hypothetical protein
LFANADRVITFFDKTGLIENENTIGGAHSPDERLRGIKAIND